jgi:hypothetical protein
MQHLTCDDVMHVCAYLCEPNEDAAHALEVDAFITVEHKHLQV